MLELNELRTNTHNLIDRQVNTKFKINKVIKLHLPQKVSHFEFENWGIDFNCSMFLKCILDNLENILADGHLFWTIISGSLQRTNTSIKLEAVVLQSNSYKISC